MTRRPGHYHAVKFYETDEVWARIGAEFLSEGLAVREPALVIATPQHRKRLTTELKAKQFDVEAMEAAGELVLFDAETMLGAFMVGGRPDANLFQATAARELDQRFRGRPIRAFGEGVDVLWKAGLMVEKEAVGGTCYRTVWLDLINGDYRLREGQMRPAVGQKGGKTG